MTSHITVWIALSCWPVVAAILYRKYSLQIATAATLLCGYLLLPERIEIDLPVLVQSAYVQSRLAIIGRPDLSAEPLKEYKPLPHKCHLYLSW